MLAPAGQSLLTLETPRLILDLDRLERNCAAMRARCEALGVALRAHLKTAKSVDVAWNAQRHTAIPSPTAASSVSGMPSSGPNCRPLNGEAM